jgi:hypothetical protein
MDQTANIVNYRVFIECFQCNVPVVLPNSAPLRLMPETPLELRVPEKAMNVGTFVEK